MTPRIPVLLLLLVSACAEPITARREHLSTTPTTPAGLSGAELETFFGPVRFARGPGAPDAAEHAITSTGFEAPFVLHVSNGAEDASNRVSSARILVDGVEVFGPSAFNQQVGDLAAPVTILPASRLTVTLAGQPNSYLDVWIEGRRSATLFCPDGQRGAMTDLRQAIVSTPPGGTLLVCDGLHNVDDVTVDRPITMRSEHPGGATLGDSDPIANAVTGRPILRITAVPQGVVRVVDLGFEMKGRGIVAEGAFDRVEIDSSRFVGRDSLRANAVQVRASVVPDGRVDVTDSRFERMSIGMWAIGAAEANVRRSRFDRFMAGPITYSFSGDSYSYGTAEDNVLTRCYNSGCIRVRGSGGSGVVIARNRIESTDLSVFAGGIDATAAAGPLGFGPVLVEGNTIVSRRTAAAASIPAGWALQNGIRINGNANQMLTVRGNVIRNAHTGVLIGGRTDATHNVVTGGVFAFQNQSGPTAVTVQFNDFVGQSGSFTGPSNAGSYQCNWWGSPNGPTSPPGNVPLLRYVPWATQPIAGTQLPCDPSPPSTVRVCSSAAPGGPPTVASIAVATQLVATGGTVLVCDGTYAGQGIQVTRPMTIQREGPGTPIIHFTDGSAFTIRNTQGGTTTIRGLEFHAAGGAAVLIEGGNDDVVIDNSVFRLSPSANNPQGANGVYVSTTQFAANRRGIARIANSRFHGGFRGVDVGDIVERVEISGSYFEHPEPNGFVVGVSPRGNLTLTGSTIVGCGEQCVGAGSDSRFVITDNRITVNIDAPSGRAIVLHSGTVAEVLRNTIVGIGRNTSHPDPRYHFPIEEAFTVHGGTIVGSDNVVSGAAWPIVVHSGTAQLTRNDITDYVGPFIVQGSAVLTCNWWGASTGPTGVINGPPSMFTPFATVPIADRPNVSCP